MSGSDKITEIISIDVPSDQIGAFVGKSGCFIKYKIVIATKNLIFGEMEDSEEKKTLWKNTRIFCHIFHEDDQTKAKLEANSEEHINLIKKSLSDYELEFKNKNSKKEKVNKIGKQKYTFKVMVDESCIGKIIGVEASNIRKLNDQIKERAKLEKIPYIRLYKEGSDNCPMLTIPNESGSGIWLHVSYYGEKQYQMIDDCVRNFLAETFTDKNQSVMPDNVDDIW